jgi:hypothetical protein
MKKQLFVLRSISSKLLFVFIIFAVPALANAQDVTFKVNLQPQLKDSIFVPGRDQIYLKGNIFPLSSINKVFMKDLAPIDSVYEATVNFSSSKAGERLKYNFFIDSPKKLRKEQMPRYIRLTRRDRQLDALYFNAFAW